MLKRFTIFLICFGILSIFVVSNLFAQQPPPPPEYKLEGGVYLGNQKLTPTTNTDHLKYTVELRKTSDGTLIAEHNMGTKIVPFGDSYSFSVYHTYDPDPGVPAPEGTEIEVVAFYNGEEFPAYFGSGGTATKLVGTGKETIDIYFFTKPGTPQSLETLVGSDGAPTLNKLDLSWIAPGSNVVPESPNGTGTVGGYEVKLLEAGTPPGDWGTAGDLIANINDSLLPMGETENRTVDLGSPMTYGNSYYVSVRALNNTLDPNPGFNGFATAQVNMPPEVENVAIGPADPKTTDDLVLTYDYSDPDGDEESGTEIKWYKDGVHMTEYDDMMEIPADATAKDQTWSVEVEPKDGKSSGNVGLAETTILNSPPVAEADGPYAGKVDLEVNFSSAGTIDADDDPLTYLWDFGNGDTSAEPNPSYTYAADGEYNVTLVVNDGEEDSDPSETTATITVNIPPVANFSVSDPQDTHYMRGETITFDGSLSVDDDDVVPDNLIFTWDFGDGSDIVVSERGDSTVTHVYEIAGTYEVTLTVQDYLDTSEESEPTQLTIKVAPVAIAYPMEGPEGDPLSFYGGDSTDEDGEITSYDWDLDGDGVFDDASGPNIEYTWYDDFSGTIELQVTDNDELTNTTEVQVTITNVAPTAVVNNNSPKVEGEEVTVNIVDIFDPGTEDTHTYEIDWDYDGETFVADETGNVVAETVAVTKTWYDNDTFNVGVKIVDDDGDSNIYETEVIVANALPDAVATSDSPVDEGSPATVTISNVTDPGTEDTHTYEIDWDYDGETFDVDEAGSIVDGTAIATKTWNDNGIKNVGVKIIDDDGGPVVLDPLEIIVNNVAPTFDLAVVDAPEGSPVNVNINNVADPGTLDTHTYEIDWYYDGETFDADETGGIVDGAATTTMTWYDNDDYTIGIRVIDDDGDYSMETEVVEVANVDPTATVDNDSPKDEGEEVTVDISEIVDPGTDDTHSYEVDWNWDEVDENFVADETGDIVDGTATVTQTWYDNSDPEEPYVVGVKVMDDDGGFNIYPTYVIVNNVAPTAEVTNDSPQEAPKSRGKEITVTLSEIADPGTLDTHTYEVDWDYDGENFDVDETGSITEQIVDGKVDITHIYEEYKEEYLVGVKIKDDDEGENLYDTTVYLRGTEIDVTELGPKPEGTPLGIVAKVLNPNPIEEYTYLFKWNDGEPDTEYKTSSGTHTVYHVWYDDSGEGTEEVKVKVTDSAGNEDEETVYPVITNVAPTATVTNDSPKPEGEEVTISISDIIDPGTLDTHTYAVDLDYDGENFDADVTGDVVDETVSVTHTWNDNNPLDEEGNVIPYIVGVRIMDDDGGSYMGETEVIITNVAPTATIVTEPVDEGSPATINVEEPNEEEPIDPGTSDIITYSFDLDNDGEYEITGEDASATKTWYEDGTYPVKVKVEDDDEGSNEYTASVVVNNVAPIAVITNDSPKAEGKEVTVYISNVEDPGTEDTHTYEIDWDWDGIDENFAADETGDIVEGSASATMTWENDGEYDVGVKIMDDDGGFNIFLTVVEITDSVPAAAFSWLPEMPKEGSIIQFTDESTSPSDEIVSWEWTFEPEKTSDLQNPKYTYFDDGSYPVTLKVTDSDEDADTVKHTVEVENVAPVVNAGLDQKTSRDKPITIVATFNDPGTLDTHTAMINWGDGTETEGTVNQALNTVTGTHTYTANGEYNVTITVTDDDEGVGTDDLMVEVSGVSLITAIYDVMSTTLILEFNSPIVPQLTCFDFVGMEVDDSGNWDFQLSKKQGLVAKLVPDHPNIVTVNLNRAIATSINLAVAALGPKRDKVDLLLKPGAFFDNDGGTNIPADVILQIYIDAFNLTYQGDVDGDGKVSSTDALIILQSTVSNPADVFPIYEAATSVNEWFAAYGKDVDVLTSQADVSGNGEISSYDAALVLRNAVELPALAPSLEVGSKKAKLMFDGYDSGRMNVSIAVDNVTNVYATDIVIKYNPDTLSIADVAGTSAVSDWVLADSNESGELRISLAGTSQPTMDGSLITVTLDAISADAIRDLDIVDLTVNDGISRIAIENLPKSFVLHQNYPNPFNPETWIPYELSTPADVSIAIYNLSGQMVRRIELGTKMPGQYVDKSQAVYWDGKNESGELVSSGVYFYQLQAGRDVSVRKMIVVK
ncbi:PKD domain-containing protein [Candidatus Poribacteria bacterium]|nr:PKD domain-containing protein [Candidatus Poribacteria bacterium]